MSNIGKLDAKTVGQAVAGTKWCLPPTYQTDAMKYENENMTARGRPIPSSRAFAGADNSFGINVLPAGIRLGEFEIIKLIDDSGFDIAYLAYDHSLDCHVRLKEYMPSGIALRTPSMNVTVRSPEYAEAFQAGMRRFLEEARLLAQLDCPSLIKVDGFWEAHGAAYMVMPFYGGITLRQALQQHGIVADEAWIKALLADLFDATETLHRVQFLHRDISPDSIVLVDDGRPILLESGAARRVVGDLTHEPGTTLKPGFASIEQYSDTPGFKQGPWSDVHALAAVAYFLVAGKPPPPAVARIVNDEMVPASIAGKGRYSESFLSALDRALAVRPEQRIQSIAALREAVGVGQPRFRARPSQARAAVSAPASLDGHAAPPAGQQEWLRTMLAEESLRKGRLRGKPMLLAGLLAAGAVAGASAYWFMGLPGMPQRADTLATVRPAPPSAETGSSLPASPKSTQSAGAGISPQERPYGESAVTEARTPEKAVAERPAAAPEQAPAAPSPRVSPEDEMWKMASSLDEPSAYESYLRRYPTGRFAGVAKSRLERIRVRTAAATAATTVVAPQGTVASAAEATAWKTAVALNEGAAYQSYLNAFPNGPNAATAREQLARLRAAETSRLAAVASRPQASAADAGAKLAEASAAPVRAAPRVDEAQPLSEPGQPAGRRTLRLAGLTMTGDFTTDPVTGHATGRVRIEWNNGDRFDGNLVKGMKEGKGRFTWGNGQTYSGDWANDQPNGRGTFLFANGNRYDGEVRNGLPHGEGTTRFRGGDMYSGSWVMGRSNGHGRYTWINGSYWEGEFRNDMRTENGKMVFSDKALSATGASGGQSMSGAAGGPPQQTANNN
ncbi:MAG: hypothetical protein JWR25_884 [Noviherbaspirillum sp.]|nr:hypothetical protein [Noviherbaspirillum sp.]